LTTSSKKAKAIFNFPDYSALVLIMSRLPMSRPERYWVIAFEWSITNEYLALSDDLMLTEYNFDMIENVFPFFQKLNIGQPNNYGLNDPNREKTGSNY